MPIERYKADDPFENHPLFKTEEQARLEETMDGEPAAFVSEPEPARGPARRPRRTRRPPRSTTRSPTASGRVDRARDFDWGD